MTRAALLLAACLLAGCLSTATAGECINTEGSARGSSDDDCAYLAVEDPDATCVSGDYDDDDWTATEMCCDCGGGMNKCDASEAKVVLGSMDACDREAGNQTEWESCLDMVAGLLGDIDSVCLGCLNVTADCQDVNGACDFEKCLPDDYMSRTCSMDDVFPIMGLDAVCISDDRRRRLDGEVTAEDVAAAMCMDTMSNLTSDCATCLLVNTTETEESGFWVERCAPPDFATETANTSCTLDNLFDLVACDAYANGDDTGIDVDLGYDALMFMCMAVVGGDFDDCALCMIANEDDLDACLPDPSTTDQCVAADLPYLVSIEVYCNETSANATAEGTCYATEASAAADVSSGCGACITAYTDAGSDPEACMLPVFELGASTDSEHPCGATDLAGLAALDNVDCSEAPLACAANVTAISNNCLICLYEHEDFEECIPEDLMDSPGDDDDGDGDGAPCNSNADKSGLLPMLQCEDEGYEECALAQVVAMMGNTDTATCAACLTANALTPENIADACLGGHSAGDCSGAADEAVRGGVDGLSESEALALSDTCFWCAAAATSSHDPMVTASDCFSGPAPASTTDDELTTGTATALGVSVTTVAAIAGAVLAQSI